MPPKVSKNSLMAKYGSKLDNAVKSHGADETNYGVVNLPGGIRNGIARLVECKFDTYKKGKNEGEFYFRAAGVVVAPDSVGAGKSAIPVKGLQTSIMIPVCDTKDGKGNVTTQEEHIEEILNEMRKLGADTNDATGADLEVLAQGLKEAKPYFRFSTSQGEATAQYPNPRVWENWFGVKGVEDYSDDGETEKEETVDNTEEAEEPEVEEEGAEETTESADTNDDLEQLIASAEDGDEDAQATLTKIALDSGATKKEVEATTNWQEVADLINGPLPSEEEAVEEDDTPAVGGMYTYKVAAVDPKTKKPLVDPKTKKPKFKDVSVEVIKVYKASSTVDLKNYDDGKTIYKGVSFDKLITAE